MTSPAELPHYHQRRMPPFRGRTRMRQVLSALVLTTAGMMLLHQLRPTQSFVSDPVGAAMHHGPNFMRGSQRSGFNPALKDVWDDEDAEPDVDGSHWGAGHLPHDIPQKVKGQTSKSKMPSHVYRDDGLVEVNPEGHHPIYDLIARAEAQWKSKLERQSRHLADA
ncbi:Glycosyltransferase Family 90 domain containing protein, partial [Ceratobasidium sp. 394]